MAQKLSFVVGVCLGALCAFGSTEYFVDPKNGQDGEGRGLTEEMAFLSIQAAVDKAVADDIITLLPGDHTEGLTTNNDGRSRVYVDKKLTIRSKNGRASRDETRIVGLWDTTESTDYPYGMGPLSTRCVYVTAAGAGSRFEGITFYRGGALHGSTANTGCGGGIFIADNKGVTAVDCAFRECQARNGSGICSMGTGNIANYAVRCLFKGNRCYKFGYGFRGGSAYNCVFDDNDYTRKANGDAMADGSAWTSGAISYSYRAINCTFVCNYAKGIGNGNLTGGIRNCLLLHNNNGNIGSDQTVYSHCVSGDADRTANGSVYVSDYNLFPEVYSTVDEDYRLVKDAKSLAAGSIEDFNLIPDEFRGTDYYGNPRTTDGVVYCGAVQGVVDGETSGVRLLGRTDGHWEKDGKEVGCQFLAVAQAPGRHATLNLRFVPNEGKDLLVYTSAGNYTIVPKRDGSGWFGTMNEKRLSSVQVTTMDANVLWVDAAAEAAGADGSAEKPFATIQAAVDAAVALGEQAVIKVKAGDYNSGETEQLGMKNRVAIPNTLHRSIKIVAVDGPETTFITGAGDPNGTATWKFGSNAVRCIVNSSTNTTVVIQGFTLRNARTATNSESADTGRGGALCSRNTDVIYSTFLADSVITNCAAGTGSCCYGGNTQRCRILGGCAYNGVVRSGHAMSCLATGVAAANADSRIWGSYASVYNCSAVDTGSSGAALSSAVSEIRNCLFAAAGRTTLVNSTSDSSKIRYSLYWYTTAALDDTNVKEDPVLFADRFSGEFRLRTESKGRTAANISGAHMLMDVNGDPFAIADDGTMVAGAFCALAYKTYYVDPTAGDDTNDGLSEVTAFKTLVGAMAKAVGGDTVVALPGTYAEGAIKQAPGAFVGVSSNLAREDEVVIASRVWVKPGVRLVSRDGAESTVIEGGTDTRCVLLDRDAMVQGFTIQHGDARSIDPNGEAATANTSGAGVLGYGGTAVTDGEYMGLVENCIIKDNICRLGAGCTYGTYRNCVFSGNNLKEYKPGVAARYAKLEGCLFSKNATNGNTHSLTYGCDIYNCTFLEGQTIVLNESLYASRVVANSLIMRATGGIPHCYNCVFGAGSFSNSATNPDMKNCVTGTVTLVDGRSASKDQPGVDAGDAAYLPKELVSAGDLAGNLRVMNGRVDAGAYEYDWRPDYSTALAKRRVEVTDVPSDATLDGKTLAWTDGTVKLDWAKGNFDSAFEFDVAVADGASLEVTLNGETLGTYTASQHVRFESGVDLNKLVFAATGNASISDFVHKTGLTIFLR